MGGYYDGDDGRFRIFCRAQGNKNDAISTESAQACGYNPIGFCIRACKRANLPNEVLGETSSISQPIRQVPRVLSFLLVRHSS